MPVINKLFKLGIYPSLVIILCHYFLSNIGSFLTENIDELCCFAVFESDVRLQSAAAVAVEVQTVIAVSSLDSYRVAVVSVRTDKALEAAVVMAYLLTCESEESFLSVVALFVLAVVLVDMLNDHVALKRRSCDEQGVLQVYLILLVVILICELDKSECGELSVLA